MKPLTIAVIAVAASSLAISVATAQVDYGPPAGRADAYQAPNAPPADNPNVQAYQNYQGAVSAYDTARDAAAQDTDSYNAKSAQYDANQRAYRHELRAYERARADYDAQYGPGAYEAYYTAPPAPPQPY